MTEMGIVFLLVGLFIALKHKWHWVISVVCLLGLAYMVFATAAGRADASSIVQFFHDLGSQ